MNLRNFLEANQCIDDDRWNIKNRHPCHELQPTCGGSKSICTVWIRPTEDFLTHLGTSFSIREHWSNKYYTHKPKINKRRLGWITWRIFYINQRNQLTWTILNTQPVPSPWSSTNLQGKQILKSNLDTSHRKFANTPACKFRYKWTLIWSMRTNRSEINNANTINKTLKKNIWLIINLRNNNNLYRFKCNSMNQE